MNANVEKKLRKTLKAIKLFCNVREVEYLKVGEIKIEYGKPMRETTERIKVNLAVLNKKKIFGLRQELNNSISLFNDELEAFYAYDDKNIKEIVENDIFYIDNVRYRVNKVESNYNIFQRIELIKDEKPNL